MRIRTRLLLLILLATLPLVAVQLYNEWSLRADRERELRASALADAQTLSHELNRLVGGVELLLASLSHRSFDVERLDGCNRYMAHLAATFPLASNIGIADTSGRVLCLNTPFERGRLYNSDRLYFRRALESRRFAIGEYMVGRATGRRVLAFGAPLYGVDGTAIAGVAYASIDLDALAEELLKRPLSRTASLTIADADGTVLLRWPERERIGERLPDEWMHVLRAPAPGVLERGSTDGEASRVVAYVPLDSPPRGLFVATGVDRAQAMGAINASTVRSLITLVVALLLSVALTFWFGRHSIRRPIERLMATAGRWKSGDLHARASVRQADAEFVEIGRTFNDMAEALAADERRRDAVEAELRQSRDNAMRASASKTEFLASASHDLRQPLQAMSMTVALLAARRGGEETPEVAMLRRAVDNLSSMVDGMMDVAQLDAGLITPKLGPVAVAPLLRALEEEFGGAAAQQGLTLTVARCTAQVHSDPVLLGRILRNLVSNALKFTPRGGAVEVLCEESPASVALRVKDSGIGIPPELHAQIFEEFHQVNNPERDRRKGLGLGLAIVKRLAALLDHPITLRSEPGAGAIFSVVAVRAAAHGETPAAAPGEAIDLPRRVLLVEDDELVAESTAALLVSWGATVIRAATAEEAEACMAETDGIDIAIVDYRLPGKSGLEVIALARKRWPSLRVVMLTGDASASLAAGADAGTIQILRKPVNAARLAAMLAELA